MLTPVTSDLSDYVWGFQIILHGRVDFLRNIVYYIYKAINSEVGINLAGLIKVLLAVLLSCVVGLMATLSADRIADNGQRIMRLEDKIGLIYKMDGKIDLILQFLKSTKGTTPWN